MDVRQAAWNLVGEALEDGWTVTDRLPHPRVNGETRGKSGGNFSVGYKVQKDGVTAFLKVFDVIAAFDGPGDKLGQNLAKIEQAYTHEKALLEFCTSSGMSRIVKILAKGKRDIPMPLPFDVNFSVPLHYIIFEQADSGDIRDVLANFDRINDAVRLEYLRQVAIGIQQLHGGSIAHQDIKPSNVVVFSDQDIGAKITDLGRASKRDMTAEHDQYFIPGDPKYAPPEQLYQFRSEEWQNQREACDLFQLGSLAAYLFSGKNATAGILSNLAHEHHPSQWKGTYAELLPQVQAAFARFLDSIAPSLPDWIRDDLITLIRLSCEPNVKKRGDPNARKQVGTPIGMDRFVSRLNVMLSEAKRRLKIR